jgi:c-di-GMP-binding flagellar brake protein YcgR
MADASKISGQKLVALFDTLVANKTIMSMHLMGSRYERITYIIGIDTAEKEPRLVVDNPEGFNKAAADARPWRLRFNFNGPDKLEYIFEVNGGDSRGKDLVLPLPDFVERIQRRKNFRIDAPLGSQLSFTLSSEACTIYLINISLGGAFGVLTQPKPKQIPRALLKKDQRIYRLELGFPGDEEMEAQTIRIKKAEVRRTEHDRERHIYKFAFEFMDMARQEKEKLTRAIYHAQRQFLQKR